MAEQINSLPTRIILVRHGQTAWNREERFRGRADIELDDVGVKQAQAVANRLKQSGITGIYSSPLKRTLQTAQPIGKLGNLKVLPLDSVIDVDYGYWQGLTIEEAQRRDPDIFLQWRHEPQKVRFPHGESLKEVRSRAAISLDQLTQDYIGQTFVIVSHIVVCRLIILHFMDLDTAHFWNIRQDNCSINTFEMREGLKIAVSINDTCHLPNKID
ncbi:histidine phosphatase family protein [Chloroflexota bacterium]